MILVILGNLEWKMCLYIVDNVSTCRIIYFQYVDTEKRIDNSPRCDVHAHSHTPKSSRAVWAQCMECSGHFQNTPLHVFTKELIREQEIKSECMNSIQ